MQSVILLSLFFIFNIVHTFHIPLKSIHLSSSSRLYNTNNKDQPTGTEYNYRLINTIVYINYMDRY